MSSNSEASITANARRTARGARRHRRPCIAAFLVTLTAGVGPALAVDGVVEISQARVLAGGVTTGDDPGFPASILSGGSYRLTSDLDLPAGATNGVQIDAGNVDLDLNGFTISGTQARGNGVLILAGGGNVAIRSGTIHGFPLDGINAIPSFTSPIRLVDVRSIGNGGFGFRLAGTGNTLERCTATDNGGVGIRVSGVASHSIAQANGGAGFLIVDGGLLVNSVARANAGFGVRALTQAGFRSNVLTANNGGDAEPQFEILTDGRNLGDNVCGSALCP